MLNPLLPFHAQQAMLLWRTQHHVLSQPPFPVSHQDPGIQAIKERLPKVDIANH